MTKIITIYENRKTGKTYELIPELMFESKSCLQDTETGEQKFYAASTLKKNFIKTEKEVEIEVETAEEELPETAVRADEIVRTHFTALCTKKEIGATIKETKSYIGISYHKKSCAQVSFTKKRLAVSVNKQEFFSYLESFENKPEVLEAIDRCYYKEAPAKYGWRMDIEFDVTDLGNMEIVSILKTAVEARMFAI